MVWSDKEKAAILQGWVKSGVSQLEFTMRRDGTRRPGRQGFSNWVNDALADPGKYGLDPDELRKAHNPNTSPEEKAGLLNEWAGSKQSKAAFAEQKGLNQKTFNSWVIDALNRGDQAREKYPELDLYKLRKAHKPNISLEGKAGLLNEWAGSKQSKAAFAEQKGLYRQVFNNWVIDALNRGDQAREKYPELDLYKLRRKAHDGLGKKEDLLEEWAESDLNQAEFADQKGISPKTFNGWVIRALKNPKAGAARERWRRARERVRGELPPDCPPTLGEGLRGDGVVGDPYVANAPEGGRDWAAIEAAVNEFYGSPENEYKVPDENYVSPSTGFHLGQVLKELRTDMEQKNTWDLPPDCPPAIGERLTKIGVVGFLYFTPEGGDDWAATAAAAGEFYENPSQPGDVLGEIHDPQQQAYGVERRPVHGPGNMYLDDAAFRPSAAMGNYLEGPFSSYGPGEFTGMGPHSAGEYGQGPSDEVPIGQPFSAGHGGYTGCVSAPFAPYPVQQPGTYQHGDGAGPAAGQMPGGPFFAQVAANHPQSTGASEPSLAYRPPYTPGNHLSEGQRQVRHPGLR